MIAHVAQSGEDRGRVVLQMRSGHPSTVALQAAVRIAQAFGSEIETLFVEDEQLIDCASFDFVREVSLMGRQQRPLSPDRIAQDLRNAARGARRQVEALARSAEVPLRSRVVRDEPLRALSVACASSGPWNVVAFAEPFTSGNADMLKQVLVEVAGSTGLVVVGPKAQRVTGPSIVAIEDTAHLPAMLRAAERLAAVDNKEVVLLLIASDAEQLQAMESDARLVMEAREGIRIELAQVARGATAAVAETLRRLQGGFVICQYGGSVMPDEGDLRPLSAALECPLFLVR